CLSGRRQRKHLADAYHVRVFDIVPHGELAVVKAVIKRDLCQRLAALDGVQLRRPHFGLARCRRGWRRRRVAKWWRRSFLHRGWRSRHAADEDERGGNSSKQSANAVGRGYFVK